MYYYYYYYFTPVGECKKKKNIYILNEKKSRFQFRFPRTYNTWAVRVKRDVLSLLTLNWKESTISPR